MAGKQQANTNVPSIQTPQAPQQGPPMTDAERDFQQFLAQVKIMVQLGQMQAALRNDPAMAQLMGPQLYNGLIAALQGQSTATLRKALGTGNMDYIDKAAGGSQDQAGRLMSQAAEGQQKVNERYRQMINQHRQSHDNTMHPSKQQMPSWMTPQAWQAIQQTQPWYAQASLLGMAPQGGFDDHQASVPVLSQHELAQILRSPNSKEANEVFDGAVKRNVTDTRNLPDNNLYAGDQAVIDAYKGKYRQGQVQP